MTKRSLIIGTVSTAALVGVWQLCSIAVASPFILPGPGPVFVDSLSLLSDRAFQATVAATCGRGVLAFSVSLALSFVLGFAAGMNDDVTAALKPWMSAVKATPVVAFILIALLWFGSSIVPVFVSVLMTLPVMTEAIAHGVRSSDSKLLEMARVYHYRRRDIFFNIRLPSAMPFFLAGAGASLGLTWKVVVAGEILSSPKYGIGSAMQTAKVHLETSRVFSLTLMAIALSVATELLFDQLVHASRRYMGHEES